MTRYRVNFIKNLCDATGHQHKCVEGVIKIHRAKDQNRATRAAQHRFARMRRIPHWDLHADFVEIEAEENGSEKLGHQ